MSAPGPARRARRGRLTRSADFDRVFRRGRSWGGRDLVLHAFAREAEATAPPASLPEVAAVDGESGSRAASAGSAEEPRVGLSVSRKVGGAVDRNRVKRLLREAVQAEADRVPEGLDLVLVARPGLRDVAERDGLAGVRAALVELLEKVERAAGAGS